jgi:putative holliday junction resolvase
MRIMAVDFGDARTGIAVCDAGEMLASPVCVIQETNYKNTLKKTAERAKELAAGQIVVGYPKNMNGTLGPRAEKSQKFAQELEIKSGIPVRLWDERCTTISASVFMNMTDTHGKKRKSTIDAAAATIILQDYLDYRRNTAPGAVQPE